MSLESLLKKGISEEMLAGELKQFNAAKAAYQKEIAALDVQKATFDKDHAATVLAYQAKIKEVSTALAKVKAERKNEAVLFSQEKSTGENVLNALTAEVLAKQKKRDAISLDFSKKEDFLAEKMREIDKKIADAKEVRADCKVEIDISDEKRAALVKERQESVDTISIRLEELKAQTKVSAKDADTMRGMIAKNKAILTDINIKGKEMDEKITILEGKTSQLSGLEAEKAAQDKLVLSFNTTKKDVLDLQTQQEETANELLNREKAVFAREKKVLLREKQLKEAK